MKRAVIAAGLALAACGVKAPPRPPEHHAPGAHLEPSAAPTTAGVCDSCALPAPPSPPTPNTTGTPSP